MLRKPWLLDSHNEAIRAKGIAEEHEILEWQRQAQDEHIDKQWRLAGEVLYVLHDGPKCRSYPSVVDGVTNTICTDGRGKK